MSSHKKKGRVVNGVLLLDKPVNISSNAALQEVKKIFYAKKAGHTGSLDPLASGMLPICFGEATKFSHYLLNADKSYLVTAKLGEVTTTADAEGAIVKQRPVPIFSAAQILSVLEKFTGAISQVPSMFSALKHEGKPLYELARQGIEVQRAPRPINIFSLKLLNQTADTIELHVHCSKGTYVRNLVEDIGEELGCGAHVSKLMRTHVGSYDKDQMVSMDTLHDLAHAQDWAALNALLLPEDTMIQAYPALVLTDTATFYLLRGQAVNVPNAPSPGIVRLVLSTGEFIGVGEIQEKGKVIPKRLKQLETLPA